MGWIDFELPGAITVHALLFLLPGYIALLIRDALVNPDRRPVKEAITPALVFAFPVYGIVLLLSLVRRFGLTATFPDGNFNIVTLFASVLVALALGFLVGAIENTGTIQRLLFRRGISRKCRVNAWVDAFEEARGSWAIVTLEDGREIYGWPKFYSDSGESPTIFLARREGVGQEATIQLPGEPEVSIPGAGVLISSDAKVKTVAFLD